MLSQGNISGAYLDGTSEASAWGIMMMKLNGINDLFYFIIKFRSDHCYCYYLNI